MMGSRLRSGFSLGLRSSGAAHHCRTRSRRRAVYRPDVAAEVSRLEDRALMTDFTAFGYLWSNDYRDNLHPPDGWYSSSQQWAPQNAVGVDKKPDGKSYGALSLTLKTATVD